MSDTSAHALLVARIRSAAEHTHAEAGTQALGGDSLEALCDLELRTVSAESGTLREQAIVPGLSACVGAERGIVQGDLAVGGALSAAQSPQVAGGTRVGHAQVGAAARVFTCTSGIKGEAASDTAGLRWASMTLPNLGPGRWLMLLQGGLGWPATSPTDERRPSAQIRVRLQLLDEKAQPVDTKSLPLTSYGAHLQDLVEAPDYESWQKVHGRQNYLDIFFFTLDRGTLPTSTSTYLHPTRWPTSLSLSCVYPAPERDSVMELILENVNDGGGLWGRCILQAVFLPKGGVE